MEFTRLVLFTHYFRYHLDYAGDDHYCHEHCQTSRKQYRQNRAAHDKINAADETDLWNRWFRNARVFYSKLIDKLHVLHHYESNESDAAY